MKRCLSILLCSAMLVVSVPGMYYAQGFESQSAYDESNQLKEIDYQLNGGYYVSGYEAPSEYPVAELPGKDDIVNQGYEFGGWYDNEELTGEPVKSITDDQYEGVVVLYARWIERYYYIDIPASVDADKDNLVISGHAGGLYEKDKVSVSVYSNNEWNLKNGDIRLGYELYNDDIKMSLVNNSVIAELTATGSDNTRKYMTRLLEVPKYAGTYTDNLTFDVTFETTKYNIKYETNGGTLYSGEKDEQDREIELEKSVFEAGTKLSDLPVPGKAGSTFLGWCYDSACTNYVKRSDRLLSDIVLYASWSDEQELKTVSIDTYARSYDVDTNEFTITLTDKTGKLTKEEVKNYLTIKNVSDSSEETSIDVAVGNVLDDGAYTFIIKCNGSWQEGSGYRLELSDDRLFFTGYDSTIREYDFTVYKPDVKNVNLGNDIKYISSESLSNLFVNGEKTDKISVTVMTVGSDGTVSQEATKTTGSFTYSGSELFVGDKIAVYDGDVVPQLDGNVISEDDVSFFEITSVNGNEYSYRGMAAEEILFVPDVLPVNIADDKDNDYDNDSITVLQSKMTYGADSPYASLGLDEDTTVDAGDYLAIYEAGDNQIQYALITSVSSDNADYVIAYTKVTWDEVQAAMDVYQTDNVKGESILENQDVNSIEQSVEQQAVDSGFAQTVVDEVAQAVERTDSYQELQDYLSQTMNADISIVPVEGFYKADSGNSEIAIYGSKKPTIKLDHVRAELSTGLKYFDNVSGLRLALDIGVEISFSNMKVVVSATFEQEVKININVSGKAIWKVWGIFPYIDDYRVAVSLDLYDYTGINFNVNVRTAEDDNEESSSKLDEVINGIAEELKSIVYAKWEAADTTYNVVDYVEGTDGVYSVLSTRQETAKTDEKVSPKPNVRNGFATPAVLSQIVNADGSTTVNYYYARNKYNIKFISEGETVTEGQYAYGTLMPTPNVYRAGYEFVGWEPAVTQTVPAKDTTYTAVWKESDDVVYTTKYYLEDENGNYKLDKAKISKGTTGQTVTADKEWYDNSRYHLSGELPSGVVAADGSLTFKVHYDRNTFNIEFNPMGGTVNRENITARWGAGVITPVPERAGYAFAGWYTDKECTEAFDGIMPADNIILYAK